MDFIGIDHGNAQIKTAHTCHESYRFDVLPFEPAEDSEGPATVCSGNFWYREKPGTVLPYTQTKVTTDWLVHTMIALADELITLEDLKKKYANSDRERNHYRKEIVLGIGVPNSSTSSRKEIEEFENFFEENSPLSYTYNGNSFDITVKKAYCFRQGRVLLTECDKTCGQRTAIVDIGGYTTDAFVTEGDGKNLRIVHTGSLKAGLTAVKRDLAATMSGVLGRQITPEIIGSWMRYSDRLPKVIGKERTETFFDLINRWASEMLLELTESIFNGLSYADLSRVVLAGGGSVAMEDALKKHLQSCGVSDKNIRLISDPVHANAAGFENAARARWNLDQKKKKRAN